MTYIPVTHIPLRFAVVIASFLCPAISTAVHAQSFLHPQNEWIYEYNIYSFGIGIISQTMEKISVGPDTLINGHDYTRLLATKDSPCRIFEKTEYLREEDNRLYRLFPDGQSEYKMIELTDSSGYEMYFGYPGSMDTATTVIDSFGTEYAYDGTAMYTQYMRILNNLSYDDETPYKVYDHVGFMQYGFLFPDLGTGLCDVFEGIRLRCFISGQDTIHFTEFDCFESSIANATQDLNVQHVPLSPNPTTGHIVIPSEFIVQEVYHITGAKKSFTRTGGVLDVRHLPSGLYIVVLAGRDRDEIYYGKVMKY